MVETPYLIVSESERCCHRPAMGLHKKDEPKTIGDMLVESVTGVPKNLGDAIDRTQITQVLGLKFGIEHFRWRELRCSGAQV